MEFTMTIRNNNLCVVYFLLFAFINYTKAEICVSSVCEFTLEIRWARTMTYRLPEKENAYNLDIDKDRLRIVNSSYFQEWDDAIGRYVDDITGDVITADGVKRNVITVNGQFPGPTIEVAEGSQVVVRVMNELFTEGITIHWHGISQLYTPWMDGAAYVTQCSIEPRTSFTYRFMANPAGTHWYHSHLENQRLDGLYGAFIVHRYVPEIPDYPVIVTDWFHEEAKTMEIRNPKSIEKQDKGNGESFAWVHNKLYSVDGHELSAVLYKSALINGRGRYGDRKLPLTTFEVEGGTKHRFRLISAAAEYSFEISLDSHTLIVIAVDGADIEPVEVTSVVVHAGETIDVEVEADQAWKQYWMRARILNAGTGDISFGERPFPQGGEVKEVKAIFRYKGSFLQGDPTTESYSCTDIKKCRVFNCPYAAYPQLTFKECISIASAQSPDDEANRNKGEFGLNDPNFDEYFLNFGYNWGASINGNRFINPTEPFSQQSSILSQVSCVESSCNNSNVGCLCTNIQEIPLNKTIQLVLTNYEPDMTGAFVYIAPHPVHLHGHNFAVVKMGFPTHEESSGMFVEQNPDIICPNRMCKTPRWNGQGPPNSLNLQNPPIKNTVIVPARGYVVIRFKTTNPGFWPIYSHTSSDYMQGMKMIFHEGADRLTLPPMNFPTCKSFSWSGNTFYNYISQSEHLTKTGNTDYTTRLTTIPTTEAPTTTTTEAIQLCQPLEENQVILSVNTMIGFGAGCISIGAFLVLIALCIYMTCQKTKFKIEGIA